MKTQVVLLVLLISFFSTSKVSAQKDSVPTVTTVNTQFQRVVVIRIKYATDLLQGLQDAIDKEKIKNAVILSGIGSVTEYTIHSVGSTTFPVKNVFHSEKGPFDIVNVNGYVFDKRIHAHLIISDLNKAVGGHLEPKTIVYTFAIVTIGVLPDDTNMKNFDNWERR